MRAKVRKPQGAREMVIDPGGLLTVFGDIVVKPGGRISAEPGGSIADTLAELTPKKGAAAAMTTALGVAHAELVFTAKTRGPGGNNITIEYVDPEEANATVAVEVDGTAIKVLLVPGEGGAITTTANDIIAAFADNTLVSVVKKSANDGSGVVTAMAATALTGGQDSTPAKKGDLYFDATNVYIAIDDIVAADDGAKWRKITHSAL